MKTGVITTSVHVGCCSDRMSFFSVIVCCSNEWMDMNKLCGCVLVVAMIHSRSVRFNKVLEVRQMSGNVHWQL